MTYFFKSTNIASRSCLQSNDSAHENSSANNLNWHTRLHTHELDLHVA